MERCPQHPNAHPLLLTERTLVEWTCADSTPKCETYARAPGDAGPEPCPACGEAYKPSEPRRYPYVVCPECRRGVGPQSVEPLDDDHARLSPLTES